MISSYRRNRRMQTVRLHQADDGSYWTIIWGYLDGLCYLQTTVHILP